VLEDGIGSVGGTATAMSMDIVERLRRVAGLGLINGGLMDDAAKEIERLRDEIEWMRAELKKVAEIIDSDASKRP
jgi:hypothetical protein